ncbi:MAG TPA: 50S ribosomal protein L4 [bacterium]|jgi:large subunit ribosomal protein L4|nr:50S ribosomal protein L4 [bacterium]
MATLRVFDKAGKEAGTVDLPDSVFGVKPHRAVLHEVLVAQLAGRRAGTHSARTRGEVAGSTRKIYRQKGTGRARHGSRKAPIFRGGGITFGPRPRSYAQDIPKKTRRLALRSALSAKAAAGQMVAVQSAALDVPKTRELVALVNRLPVAGVTLFVTPQADAVLMRAAANLSYVRVRTARGLTVYDVLSADYVVLVTDAVPAIAEVWG